MRGDPGPFHCPVWGGVHMLGGPSWGVFRCPGADSGFDAPHVSARRMKGAFELLRQRFEAVRVDGPSLRVPRSVGLLDRIQRQTHPPIRVGLRSPVVGLAHDLGIHRMVRMSPSVLRSPSIRVGGIPTGASSSASHRWTTLASAVSLHTMMNTGGRDSPSRSLHFRAAPPTVRRAWRRARARI